MRHFIFLFLVSVLSTSAQLHELKGTIKEYFSQKPVADANVRIKKLNTKIINGTQTQERIDFAATNTNDSGFYHFTLPTGEYVVEATYVGYIKRTKFIDLKKNIVIDLELSDQINQLDDVEIKAKKAESNVSELDMGVIKVNIQNMKKLPVVFGEADLIKTLTIQPGVTTVGEGAGGFNVRGGRVDQNLVLLDGAPLFNTSHLLGLFTSVNSEVLQTATLYKGTLSAAFGGRLSSILEMYTKSAKQKRKVFGIGPISSNLLYQNTFAKEKGSIMVAARGAYPNWVLQSLPRRFRGSKASFYDLNLACQYNLTSNQNLKFSTYRASDAFKFPEDTSYTWASQTGTFQHAWAINKQWSLNTKAIYSHYNYKTLGLAKSLEYQFTSTNQHTEVKSDVLFQQGRHKFEAGLSHIWYGFSPGSVFPTSAQSSVVLQKLNAEFAREMAAYIQYEWKIAKAIGIQTGLRNVYFENLGGYDKYFYAKDLPKSSNSIISSQYFNKGQKTFDFTGFEPRVGIKWQLSQNASIKMGYNKMHQFLHLITNTTAISPVDFWKLANEYIPPAVSDQWSTGLFKNFDDNNFETSIEVFYKKLKNIVEYKDGALLQLNRHIETELLPAIGKAYGLEASIQKNRGRLTGSLSYTYSRSLSQTVSVFETEQLNKGSLFPSAYDKPHNLNINTQVFLGNGWTASSNFVYQTGRPITYPDGQYVLDGSLIFNYSQRNVDRLPDYHRFDLSISKDSRRSKSQSQYNIINFSIYNLYARKNPYSIYFKQYLDVSRSYRLSVLGTIVPSLTLTFYR